MARTLSRAGVTNAVGYNPYNSLSLDFSKTRYAGAMVKCRLDASIAEIDAYDTALEKCTTMADRYELFADMFLIEWNLEDAKGKSIPATKAGARQAPAALMGWVINTWRSAIWDVAVPLGDGSTPG